MLLGKRPRPPMRRTRSMSGFSSDVLVDIEAAAAAVEWLGARQDTAAAGGRAGVNWRSSGDFASCAVETATFLRACGLCKRPLGPGRDTFIYRGDSAFCSLECRQQQMNQDEKKEKCAPASGKGSGNGETVAAA